MKCHVIVVGSNIELSKKIQNMLFESGFRWGKQEPYPQNVDAEILTVYASGDLYYNHTRRCSWLNNNAEYMLWGAQEVTQALVDSWDNEKREERKFHTMTVAEIEKALGISNLKIVKEKE